LKLRKQEYLYSDKKDENTQTEKKISACHSKKDVTNDADIKDKMKAKKAREQKTKAKRKQQTKK
jgi:hypothetical protein